MESDVLIHSILPWIVGEEKSRMFDFMGRNVHLHGDGGCLWDGLHHLFHVFKYVT
jgi:hypothetical protein